MKKVISLILAAVLCLSTVCCAFAAEGDAYTILNPYEGVDWQTYHAYKTALHSHTNASDGNQTLRQSLERHVQTGFDIVAITDHGVIDRNWAEGNDTNLIKTVLGLMGRSEGALDYIGYQGTFEGGMGYTYKTLANGDQYLYTDTGRTVLKMPYGIENNAVSVNAHVNSWFAPYSDNSVTTYEDAVKGVDAAGGVCVINHPGEYTKARYALRTDEAYDENNASYAYYINKYATLIDEYDALIGIDMNSKGDNRTRFDRKLWDILLTRFSANGKNVYGICSSDAHQLGVIDTGFSLLLMPALTSAAARKALESGQFFGASHCIGNYDELIGIAEALRAYYGEENETYVAVQNTVNEMTDRIEGIENGKYDADDSIGVEYSVLENGFTTVDTFPAVRSITVNDNENTIAIAAENALLVRFISNGTVFAVKTPDAAVIDLDDYSSQLGDYVRVEVFGEGGILYTQAFLLNAEKNAGAGSVKKGVYFNLGFIDFLLAELRNWKEIIVRYFSNLF
ncbi:MAG: PHP domain-containing protein [Clostridia bacterium]|nr:PHP domain-containing protein [Clostridia bacterium]